MPNIRFKLVNFVSIISVLEVKISIIVLFFLSFNYHFMLINKNIHLLVQVLMHLWRILEKV